MAQADGRAQGGEDDGGTGRDHASTGEELEREHGEHSRGAETEGREEGMTSTERIDE
jgi:hypothetical protein